MIERKRSCANCRRCIRRDGKITCQMDGHDIKPRFIFLGWCRRWAKGSDIQIIKWTSGSEGVEWIHGDKTYAASIFDLVDAYEKLQEVK